MKFKVENKVNIPNTTISAEAAYVMLVNVYDFINQMMAKAIRDSFAKGKPLKNLEINVTLKADNKEVDTACLLEKYPEVLGLSEKKLAEIILKRAGFVSDK